IGRVIRYELRGWLERRTGVTLRDVADNNRQRMGPGAENNGAVTHRRIRIARMRDSATGVRSTLIRDGRRRQYRRTEIKDIKGVSGLIRIGDFQELRGQSGKRPGRGGKACGRAA